MIPENTTFVKRTAILFEVQFFLEYDRVFTRKNIIFYFKIFFFYDLLSTDSVKCSEIFQHNECKCCVSALFLALRSLVINFQSQKLYTSALVFMNTFMFRKK